MQHSVFALELCCPFEPHSPLRKRLYDLIVSHPAASSFHDKWSLYQALSDALLSEMQSFEYGCWDFYDDDSIATQKYQEWCNGLLAEEGVRQSPSSAPAQGPYRQEAERRYMTFTMAFLMTRGSNSERTLAARCDVTQANLWRRDVVASLVQGVRYLNFASIQSDVVYMIPGRDDYGLTPEDLGSGKFEYLRKLA
jgi:hypothetical protein